MFTNNIYLIFGNKPDLALNNLQWLICQKTKQNKTNRLAETDLVGINEDRV